MCTQTEVTSQRTLPLLTVWRSLELPTRMVFTETVVMQKKLDEHRTLSVVQCWFKE